MSDDGDVQGVPEVIVVFQHVFRTFGHWQSALQESQGLLGMEVHGL